MLFPTHRWFTAEMETLRIRNRLEFTDLADRQTQIAAHPANRIPLPVAAKSRPAGQPKVRAVIQRLQVLLRTLVPLPGKPFRKSAGAYVPLFQIRIHPKLLAPCPR